MFENRSNSYLFLFFATCFLMLIRIAIIITVFVSLFVEMEGNKVSSLVIILLLIDLFTLVLLWSFNKGTAMFPRRTSMVFLMAPILLLVVFVLSIMIDIASPSAKTIEIICWVLMWAYLLIPNIYIILDFIWGLKTGFSGNEPDPKIKPLSQRIKEARK